MNRRADSLTWTASRSLVSAWRPIPITVTGTESSSMRSVSQSQLAPAFSQFAAGMTTAS